MQGIDKLLKGLEQLGILRNSIRNALVRIITKQVKLNPRQPFSSEFHSKYYYCFCHIDVTNTTTSKLKIFKLLSKLQIEPRIRIHTQQSLSSMIKPGGKPYTCGAPTVDWISLRFASEPG